MFQSYHKSFNNTANEFMIKKIEKENIARLNAHIKNTREIPECESFVWSLRHIAYFDKKAEEDMNKRIKDILAAEKYLKPKMLNDYNLVEPLKRNTNVKKATFHDGIKSDNHLGVLNTDGTLKSRKCRNNL